MAASRKILVTGAGGQLGRALLRSAWPDALAPVAARRGELDICSAEQVERVMSENRYDAVINAAAFTAVDDAERNVAAAYAVNLDGSQNLARECARRGAILIHVSTDYVFDGTKREPYAEDDAVNPACAYGRSKEAGERAIRASVERHVILRTAWLFSAGPKNFVNRILRLGAERPELTVVSDQVGSPTSAGDLAYAIVELLQTVLAREAGAPWGTYHCANAESASWYELACEALDRAAPHLRCRAIVRPIPSAEYPQLARRPANSRLDCTKIDLAFGIRLRPWRMALAPVVDEIITELRP